MKALRLLLVAALSATVVVGCGTGPSEQTAASDQTSQKGAGHIPAAQSATGQDQAAIFLSQYPPQVINEFGTLDVSRYSSISPRSTQDNPYVVPWGGVSYFGPLSVSSLVSVARLAIRGTVLAVSPPYYTSDEMGWWDEALLDVPGVVPPVAEPHEDVLVLVAEVYGDKLGLASPGQTLTFTMYGGGVLVTISDDVAAQLEYPGGGAYLFGIEPEVDLTVGEDVILLADKSPVYGIWGGTYSFRYMLTLSHFGKFILEGDQLVNPGDDKYSLSLSSFKDLVASTLATRAGPEPLEGTFPKPQETLEG